MNCYMRGKFFNSAEEEKLVGTRTWQMPPHTQSSHSVILHMHLVVCVSYVYCIVLSTALHCILYCTQCTVVLRIPTIWCMYYLQYFIDVLKWWWLFVLDISCANSVFSVLTRRFPNCKWNIFYLQGKTLPANMKRRQKNP